MARPRPASRPHMLRSVPASGSARTLGLLILAIGTLCACASASPAGSQSRTTTLDTAAHTSVSPHGSATATASTVPVPPPDSTPTPTTGRPTCAPGNVVVHPTAGEQPTPVCVRVGAHVTATLHDSATGTWAAARSINPHSAAVSSVRHGAYLAINIRAVAAGQTNVTAQTTPPAGATGPPSQLWELTIYVIVR